MTPDPAIGNPREVAIAKLELATVTSWLSSLTNEQSKINALVEEQEKLLARHQSRLRLFDERIEFSQGYLDAAKTTPERADWEKRIANIQSERDLYLKRRGLGLA